MWLCGLGNLLPWGLLLLCCCVGLVRCVAVWVGKVFGFVGFVSCVAVWVW